MAMLYRVSINPMKKTISLFQYCKRQECTLKACLAERIPEQIKIIKAFKKKHGNDVMSKATINSMYGGMRGIKAMVWETSNLDSEEGIKFRGKTIPELQKELPKAECGKQPLPEGIFWLLCTGDIPTKEQVDSVSCEWACRAKIPIYIKTMIKNMPPSVHPMTQLSCAVTALNKESHYAKAYSKKIAKAKYWEYVYEDAMNLIAKISIIAGMIYRHTYKHDDSEVCVDNNVDYSHNFSTAMGYCTEDFRELMRMYITIHSDHEGGNVSAHTAHLVSSALSDPYLSWGAGLNGLAGPLHGLANQEVLVWVLNLKKKIGKNPTDDQIKDFILETLKSGYVIPGFGHAVLRKTDPRYICLREYALENLPNDPLFKIISQLFKIVPPILTSLGKVQNPWPNVDAHSGTLLQYYGMKETNFYTVLFGVSRSVGVMASLIWGRALGMPIERPKSMTTKGLMKAVKYNSNKKKEADCCQ